MPTSKNFELGSFANNVDHDPSTGDTEISNNITLTGELRGPSTFIIDPAAVGDATGLLQIKGNLQVDGTTTTINSTTLDVDDLNITVAKGAASAAAANGAGLTVDGANATFTYTSADNRWNLNKDLNVANVYGNVTGTVSDISNHSIGGLSDVDTTTTAPTSGQTIVWDGAKFVPGDSFSQSDFNTAFSAKNVGDLADVDTAGITNGQTLVYDIAQTKFIPGTASGGGTGGLYSLLDF
tara:strand:+ start:699 stop:1412 length:714 start_codon:yes stop_codon:yes gene_type:complete